MGENNNKKPPLSRSELAKLIGKWTLIATPILGLLGLGADTLSKYVDLKNKMVQSEKSTKEKYDNTKIKIAKIEGRVNYLDDNMRMLLAKHVNESKPENVPQIFIMDDKRNEIKIWKSGGVYEMVGH